MKNIVCIDDTGPDRIENDFHLTLGKVYGVINIILIYDYWVFIIDDSGKESCYPLRRFIDLKEYRKKKLKSLECVSNQI